MVQPCCYCGIPLQRAAQYVGIADVILGLINFIFVVIHVKEMFEYGITSSSSEDDSVYSSSSSSSSSWNSHSYRNGKRIRTRTFPGLDFLPRELALFICICYGIQFLMGIVLYISAVNKNRSVCLFWMGVTAVTALFTGLFIRLYEMLIVNEFVHELKLEQEVTYFPGQNPIQATMQHHQQQQPPHYQPQQAHPIVGQQPMMGNPLVPSADTHVSVITIPTVTPSPYNNMAAPELYPHGYYPSAPAAYPPHQYQQAPAALQPPPYYEVAGNGMGEASGGSSSTGNRSTGYPVESVLFPTDKNDYRNSFSKF